MASIIVYVSLVLMPSFLNVMARHQQLPIIPVNSFLLFYDSTCDSELSMKDLFSKTHKNYWQIGLHIKLLEATFSNLVVRKGFNHSSQFFSTNQPGNSFKDYTIKHRRQLANLFLESVYYGAFLGTNALRSKKKGFQIEGAPRRLQSAHTPRIVLHRFSSVWVDIIDNTVLPNDTLFQVAHFIPCLLHPPERNQPRYPLAHDVVIPNDPLLLPTYRTTGQWYLGGPDTPRLNQTYGANVLKAWRTIRGETGPIITLLEAGCSDHPDLQMNLCSEGPCEGIDLTPGIPNFYYEPLSAVHGTPVAGIIGATANNNYKLSGVCWGCNIRCVKMHDGTAPVTSAMVATSLEFLDGADMRVLYIPFGGPSESMVERLLLEKLEERNVTVVVPAGNDGCDVDLPFSEDLRSCIGGGGILRGTRYPARYNLPNIIAVASSTELGLPSRFTNWGGVSIDLFAPGEDILAPYNTMLSRRGSAIVHGTSFAAALVAGILGLIFSRRPDLTPRQAINILRATVTPVKALKGRCRSGGIINAAKAIELMGGLSDPKIPQSYPKPSKDFTPVHYTDMLLDIDNSATAPSSEMLFQAVLLALVLQLFL